MSSGPRLRPAVLAARERLAGDRAKLKEQHARGTPGIQLCSHLADMLDEVVLHLYQSALPDIGGDSLESEIALVAHGGYGRRDVAPFSDVDLMLLTAPAAHERAAELAKYLTRDICDAGLQLGFSLRTPAEACSMAWKDATIFTSLAESRLLAGSERLFERFLMRFRKSAQRRWRSLVLSIIDSRHEERKQFGDTAYLLQPNIKRSRGGLRDIQIVRWVGFTRFGESELESLYRTGALSRSDFNQLVRCHEFLLRLRNELHFFAGKSQDLLTRDEQVRLAELYKYEQLNSVLPVERFMRDYYDHTGEIRHVSANFVDGVRATSRLAARLAPLISHKVEEDLRVGPIHISATRKGLPRICGDLDEVLRVMDLANMYKKRIDHTTWDAIRNAMSHRPIENISAAAVERFLSLLSQPGRLPDLLRRLHQLRVLEQIIPAMQHARNLVQFNDYHKFTVDEHSIRAVECATDFVHDSRPVGIAYRDLRDKRLLHLALLIHDLGKGYDDDHCEVGALIAVETARRLNLSEHDSETLRFLVSQHLLMPHMAFREDMRDESVVLRLAREVGSPDVLQMLYILSCADLAAVGPKVLNDWKLELLTELYYRTRRHLTGEAESWSADRTAEERRASVRDLVAPSEDPIWWDKHIEALPSEYLLSVSPERIHAVLARLKRLRRNEVTAWARYDPERKVTIYLVGADETVTPGIFHKLTGALTGKGLQILSAEIHTLADDLVLDRFYVEDNDFSGPPPEERTNQVCDTLVAALTSGEDEAPAFRRLWRTQPGASAADYAEMPTTVRFDDSTSERYTIVTILTYDRRGLLYSIARTLFELGLVVHVAKIGTYLDQVVDAFYVTDSQGHKVYSQQVKNEIRRRLTESIAPPSPDSSPQEPNR
jgi:[protein-PII] uridylyltransferase